MHPWVKEIQAGKNEGPHPFQGDTIENSKNALHVQRHIKNFF